MADAVTQRPSTIEDYFNVNSAFGIQYNNPETRFNFYRDTRGSLDTTNPEFDSLFKSSDIHTKRAMLEGRNTDEAIAIARRRNIYDDSAKAIAQDNLVTQFAYGALPALVNPSTALMALPGGAAFQALTKLNAASNVLRVSAFGAAGGALAGTANVIDESFMAQQGLQHDYLNSFAMGMLFGGGLGMLGGALSGPASIPAAQAISHKYDDFQKHFASDPDMSIKYHDDGTVQLIDIGQMEKNVIDRIPIINKYLRSDIHTLAQSDSPVLRYLGSRIAPTTISRTDSEGNIIPSAYAGMDDKRKLKGNFNTLIKDIEDVFTEAHSTGLGQNRQDFNIAVWDTYVKAMQKQNRDAHAYAKMQTDNMPTTGLTPAQETALRKAYKDAYNEYLDNGAVEFNGLPSHVKGAQAYRKYYSTMLQEGQKRGVKELQDINPNRLYAPRIYNFKALHKGKVTPEQAKLEIREALISAPENSFKDTKEVDMVTDDIYNKLMSTSFDLNYLTTSFLAKELPFGTHLKNKKLYLDESKMPSLLVNDFHDVTGMYHYKMSGRMATQFAFGTDNLSDIHKMIADEHLKRGIIANKEEIEALDRSVQDLLGTLRMNNLSNTPAWTFTRNINTYNSARLMGGAGGNQLIELAGSLMMVGMQGILKGGFGRALRDSGRLLYTKGKVDDEFSNFIIASGYMEEALHTSRINRFADTEVGFNTGTVENSLHWLADKQMKYNGMRYLMGVMENFTGGSVLAKLQTGKVDAETLARWGMTPEQAKSLKADIDMYYHPKEGKFELDKFSQENRDRLQLAISRGIDEIVIQGDSIHAPGWAKTPGVMRQLIFQFTRFPLIAQEVLLRSGMKERQAEMVAAMFASSLMYMSIKHLREQAAIGLGWQDESTAKYDYFNSNADMRRALAESINYNAPLGFMSSVYNYGAIVTGNPEIGREWINKDQMTALLGPTAGLGEDVLKLLADISDGTIDDERNFQKAKSLMPWLSMPVISEGAKELAKELGE